MSFVLRAAFFAGSLAVGSWLGLGKPSAEQGHALAARAKAGVESQLHKIVDKSPQEGPKADPRAEAPQPLPRPDLGDVPSLRPWPQLNAEATLEKAWMVAEGPAYAKDSGRRLVTLTFDDGPFPETTPAVLKALAKYKVHASFFVIGRYLDGDDPRAEASRETLKQVAAAGHLIGNHTHDHQSLTAITHTQVLEQIDRGASSIERVTGQRPILFRPPYGKLDEFGQNAVRARGLDLLLWSIDKQDMLRTDSHTLFRELVAQIDYKQGGIVLLHDIRWSSVAALREVLDWLDLHRWDPKRPARRGYEIVDLPTYLRAVAASPSPHPTRDELEIAREAESQSQAPSPSQSQSTSRPATASRRKVVEREAPEARPSRATTRAKARMKARAKAPSKMRSSRR